MSFMFGCVYSRPCSKHKMCDANKIEYNTQLELNSIFPPVMSNFKNRMRIHTNKNLLNMHIVNYVKEVFFRPVIVDS